MVDFINAGYIEQLLREAADTPLTDIDGILDKAARFEGLTHAEVAALLTLNEPLRLARLFEVADQIKQHIYGDRVVMFAPLYVSDHCINRCVYCGFNQDNPCPRRRLTLDEVRAEVRELEQMGHKRLALEAGEDPLNCPLEYILDVIKTIYDMKFENGAIRRVNVNIAATSVEKYRRLHAAQIGTYILFQETYHEPTYRDVHLSGPKSDYDYHTTAFDRAMEAGIEDVGGGALFGLYDPYFEVIGLMLHNEHLEQRFGVGFHTISLPRIRRAAGAPLDHYPHAVDDETFKKLVAVVRLAVPYTGIIISTRESRAMRATLIRMGVSQLSGGSSVEVGGYTARGKSGEQFTVEDAREAGSIIEWLLDEGLVPSFCTACYRKGRTGDRFMQLARDGSIKNVCLPNALMTLWEYASDYGDSAFQQKARTVIDQQLLQIQDDAVRTHTAGAIERISTGERDVFV